MSAEIVKPPNGLEVNFIRGPGVELLPNTVPVVEIIM